MMRCFFVALAVMLSGPSLAMATTLEFDFTARVDSAFLRNPVEDAQVADGAILQGRMTFSDPPTLQFGGTYQYSQGLEVFSISTEAGYSLELSTQIVSVSTFNGTDLFTAQSFVSEDPNGWNMVLDIITTGWLNGDTSLPTSFPDTFDIAFMSAYFLDEFDTIQSIDATVLSITPVGAVAPIPLPATGLLMVGGLALLTLRRFRRPKCEG